MFIELIFIEDNASGEMRIICVCVKLVTDRCDIAIRKFLLGNDLFQRIFIIYRISFDITVQREISCNIVCHNSLFTLKNIFLNS